MSEGALTPLVPEKEVFPVCTNGMQTGKMVVTSQNKMRNTKGHYLATYLDKPANFKCVYLGILVAIIGGIITAMVASGVGAVVAGLLIATLVGIIASYGLGGAVCSYCLNAVMWDKTHPKILIDGKAAIIGNSKIICQPLWFSSGTIQIFYSKDYANKTAQIYAVNNMMRIFNGSFTGLAIGSPFKLAGSLHKIGMSWGQSALWSTGITLGGFTIGVGISQLTNPAIEKASDYLSDYSNDTLSIESIPDENYTSNVINIVEDGLENSIAPSFSYQNYENIINASGSVQGPGVLNKDLWTQIKADPRYSPEMLNTLKSEYLKLGHADYNAAKKPFSMKETFKSGLKGALAILGLGLVGNLVGQTLTKIFTKNLEHYYDEEINAIAELGIYEQEV